MKCKFCNKSFNKTQYNQKYCKPECRIKSWNNQKRKNGWRLINAPPKNCEVCNKKFQPFRKTTKYCSNKCSKIAHPPPHTNTGIYQIKFWTNKKWIEENYLKPQISISQVCKKYKISKATFYHWLERLNIKSLPKSIVQKGEKNPFHGKNHTEKTKKKLRGPRPHTTGANNHSWKGGYTPYYGPNWIYQHPKVRKRDNNTCQDCGLYQTKPKLIVHHKIPFRFFGLEKYQEANKLSNLITVCIYCHAERHNIINSLNYQSLDEFPVNF